MSIVKSSDTFIKLTNLSEDQRRFVHILSENFGLKHVTMERDSPESYLIISKGDYSINSNNLPTRVQSQIDLVASSLELLAVHENVNDVLKAITSQKQRGRKPNSLKAKDNDENNEQRYELRNRKKN
ncbi:unnamed protein product [Brachionus calyciflorus]|uniref:R3H domain-containing protein n=1 Tax=Brachionus calyciflorus TaxID=104777 RepID=A0A813XCC7_9BILA|nr:unnamed protein product [Brachionus calyciflorus]